MSRMTNAIFMTIALSAFITTVDANTFLHPSHHDEHISEEDVQTSLLAEIEGTFGHGTASSRVQQMEAALGPMYAALPKNEQGYLGHATVRYALHRLFVQRHGWYISGLDAAGGHRNASADVGLLKEQVPTYIQDLFEKRLGGRGFGLHELSVLAATIEHLIHSEAIKRLGDALKVHRHLPTSSMSTQDADEVMETYMMAFILGEDLTNMTHQQSLGLVEDMPGVYAHWLETVQFLQEVRHNTSKAYGTAEQKACADEVTAWKCKLDFALVARVAETVADKFGAFQDQDCQNLKGALVKLEDAGTGRVRLSNFYKGTLASNGGQQGFLFTESVPYLRELGALDESDAQNPRVIIANYISAPSNCLATSSFYSVCCMDECEGLLGHLEHQLAAPQATPARIAALVSNLSSSSVASPRQLPASLLQRLEEIAAGHGGSVQLHGRLFAQWMHHAFPRECPYPHLSGTTKPKTTDEWVEETGEKHVASKAEMRKYVNGGYSPRVNSTGLEEMEMEMEMQPLPWSPEEELLVTCTAPKQTPAGHTSMGSLRNVLMFASMTGIAYGMVHHSWTAQGKAGEGIEKFFV